MMKSSALMAATCLLLVFLSDSCFAKSNTSTVIARLDPKALQLLYTNSEGGGQCSVIDSGRVVLCEGNELLIIKDGAIERRLECPEFINCFDLDHEGNGILVSDSSFYRVRGLKIESSGVASRIPCSGEGNMPFCVDIVNDSTVRIVMNMPQFIVLADVNHLEMNRYVVQTDTLSALISGNINAYIGEYRDEHYFLEFPGQPGNSQVRAIRFQSGRITNERIVDIGNIGRSADFMWHPVRFDENTGHFYTMLSEDGILVIREFDIRDFSSEK